MSSRLLTHFKQRRVELNLKLADLARLVGYKNVAKGANRIVQFEREGIIKEDLLIKLAEALGIDWGKVEELIDQDCREYAEAWEKWADVPVAMIVVIKWMPCVYSEVKVPPHISTQEAAEAFACELARKHHKRVTLVVSRRKSVWIREEGNISLVSEATPFNGLNSPWMQLKSGQKFRFGSGEKPV